MKFLTNEKLVISGAAGMIGSNMAQTAIMMGLSSNICLYDIYLPGLEGVVEELRHCAFPGINITFTDKVEKAFKDAKYMVSSGGAPRKAGMTREDLLVGNTKIAKQLGEDIKQYCPDLKHCVVIFNPADITGLVALVYSGLEPSRITTLAALDSTRLQSALAKHFGIAQDKVTTPRTYGGHGEQMAVFASTAKIDGKPLTDIIGTPALTDEQWAKIKQDVIKGGAKIIELRGRSSFQSPSYISIKMVGAAMGAEKFEWPSGCYVNNSQFKNVIMAMPSMIDAEGVHYKDVKGNATEMAAIEASYKHLQAMRDEVISLGVLPPVSEWKKYNPHL